MSDRLTQKQENFTQNIFKGMTQRDAWIYAGYSSKYALALVDVHACHLANRDKIKIRLEELRGEVKSNNIMTVTQRQERLSEISRANLTDFVDKEGNITLESDNQGALQEVTVSELRSSKKEAISTSNIKVKLHNPISAIAELNKMDHVYETERSVEDEVKIALFDLLGRLRGRVPDKEIEPPVIDLVASEGEEKEE